MREEKGEAGGWGGEEMGERRWMGKSVRRGEKAAGVRGGEGR